MDPAPSSSVAQAPGRIMSGEEYVREFGDTSVRWCFDDLVNSGYHYTLGRNVHPEPDALTALPGSCEAARWFFFAPSAHALRFASDHGRRLLLVRVPPHARVWVRHDGACAKATEFFLEDIQTCTLCFMEGCDASLRGRTGGYLELCGHSHSHRPGHCLA